MLQQVWPNVNFYNPNDHLSTYPPVLLVNGQPSLVITMRPGETQRWRFVNATMQAGAQLELDLAAGMKWRQIAQDGVQFAEASYQCQPLYSNSTAAMSTISAKMDDVCDKLYPGNGAHHHGGHPLLAGQPRRLPGPGAAGVPAPTT